MSTVIVLLPARDTAGARDWTTCLFPFAFASRNGESALETGFAALNDLPKGSSTVLVVAARDTLMLNASLPPVQGVRLRRMLPNVVEEHLMQDAQHCHFAIAPAVRGAATRCIAVMDRAWFAELLDRFAQAGHRRVRAVPLAECLPLPWKDEAGEEIVGQGADGAVDALARMQVQVQVQAQAGPDEKAKTLQIVPSVQAGKRIVALVVPNAPAVCIAGNDANGADETNDAASQYMQAPHDEHAEARVELALRRGALGFGFSVAREQLGATLTHFSNDAAPSVYRLQYDASTDAQQDHASTWKPMPWQTLARAALGCRFNLCQFEFGSSGRGGLAAHLRRLRVPLSIVAATLVVALITVNVQWLRLRHQRDALEAELTQLAQQTLPPNTVLLDPRAQMIAQMARIKAAAGELRADDFLTLAAGIAHALGTIPAQSMALLNYNGGVLKASFKPGTTVDRDAFAHRLAEQGIAAHEEGGKWTLKPSPSARH